MIYKGSYAVPEKCVKAQVSFAGWLCSNLQVAARGMSRMRPGSQMKVKGFGGPGLGDVYVPAIGGGRPGLIGLSPQNFLRYSLTAATQQCHNPTTPGSTRHATTPPLPLIAAVCTCPATAPQEGGARVRWGLSPPHVPLIVHGFPRNPPFSQGLTY